MSSGILGGLDRYELDGLGRANGGEAVLYDDVREALRSPTDERVEQIVVITSVRPMPGLLDIWKAYQHDPGVSEADVVRAVLAAAAGDDQ